MSFKDVENLMVYGPETVITYKIETVSTNIPVPIARTEQRQMTDVMIRRGNGIVEGKYVVHFKSSAHCMFSL
jgi:hypothetical protein